MTRFRLSTLCSLVAMSFFIAGCNSGNDTASDTAPADHDAEGTESHDAEAGHSHSSVGPHGGSIVELGGAYHAEVVHGDDGTVTVYVLDGNAAANSAIDAGEMTINISHEGTPEQFTLAASPEAGDAEGKSSRFVSTDAELGAHLDEEGATARLVVMVDGTSYSGAISHTHDHADGHTHSHSGDDALVWAQKDIEHEGYAIMLGHHGEHLHAGEEVEPAVSIMKDGEPVADAQVFNALASADGTAVVAEEVATVYEPPTAEEPAHYAQGGLQVPAGADKVVIRFRIVLPGEGGEVSYDVPVDVE